MNPPNPPSAAVPLAPDEVELLKKYRDVVMPAARLSGYDDFAKWLFTITAVIGTLGAAFSNSALKTLRGAGVTLFFLAIVATALSLAFAVIQRSIDLRKVNWHSLDDMLKKTESALHAKRFLAWCAGTSFAVALVLAGLAPFLTANSPPDDRGKLAYAYGKDGIHATLTLSQTMGTEAQVEILTQSASGGTLIAAQRAVTDASGLVHFDITSTQIPAGSTGVQVMVRCGAKMEKGGSVLIPLQRTTTNVSSQNAPITQNGDLFSCQ
jgi:hypothetical protein